MTSVAPILAVPASGSGPAVPDGGPDALFARLLGGLGGGNSGQPRLRPAAPVEPVAITPAGEVGAEGPTAPVASAPIAVDLPLPQLANLPERVDIEAPESELPGDDAVQAAAADVAVLPALIAVPASNADVSEALPSPWPGDEPAAPVATAAVEASSAEISVDTAPVARAPTALPPGHASGQAPATQATGTGSADIGSTVDQAGPRQHQETALATRPARLAADLGIEVVRQIGSGRSDFTIRLDPPELGRIDVRLEMHRNEVRAIVSTDNPSTYDLLRRDADNLARALVDGGLRADAGALRFDLKQDNASARTPQPAFAASSSRAEQAPADPKLAAQHRVRRGLLDLIA